VYNLINIKKLSKKEIEEQLEKLKPTEKEELQQEILEKFREGKASEKELKYVLFELDKGVQERVQASVDERGVKSSLYRFWHWIQGSGSEEIRGLTPSELLEFKPKDIILDDLKSWILTLFDDVKYNSLATYWGKVRGFFKFHDKHLPPSSFLSNIKRKSIKKNGGETENKLNPALVKWGLAGLKQVHRTAILCMFQGCMDRERFNEWNENGWENLQESLIKGERPRIVFPDGRKKNTKKYHSYLGKDSVNELKNYIDNERKIDRAKSDDPHEYIFYSQQGTPLSGDSVYDVWLERMKKNKEVEIDPDPDNTTRYGVGVHNLRDVFSSQTHKITGVKDWVIEYFMGHEIDELGYNTAYNDEAFMFKQYELMEPYLNIWSNPTKPFGYIEESEADKIEEDLNELKEINRHLQTQVRTLSLQLNQAQAQKPSPEAQVFKKPETSELLVKELLKNPDSLILLAKEIEARKTE
jgi:integrase